MPYVEPVKPEVETPATPAAEQPKTEVPKDEAKKVEEKKTEEAREEEKPQPKDSQRYAALARKEKALVDQQRQLAEAREQIQQQYGQMQQSVQEFQEIARRAKTDPLSVLQALGVSQEEFSQYLANGGEPTTDGRLEALQQEIQNLQQQREQDLRQLQEGELTRQQQQEQQIIEGFNEEVSKFVQSKPDDYEFIIAYDQAPLVTEVIREAFEVNGGELMDPKEAADMVEEYLVGLVEKGSKTKKFGAKFGQNGKPSPTAQPAPTKTLSNQHSASTPSPPQSSYEDERLRRALAAAEAAKTQH